MTRSLDPEGAHLGALRRLADFRGRRVLEMGCGEGRLTVGIAADAAHVLAFDPDAESVARARLSLPTGLAERIAYRQASALELEIERGAFDLVVFSWSLWCVPPEDVVDVLGRMLDAAAPGGLVLDLQVIRPNPLVTLDGRVVCEIDGEPLFEWADAAVAAVDDRIAAGELEEEAMDDHDVRTHYPTGRDVVEDFAESRRRLPGPAVPRLQAITEPSVVAERCRLRRLRVLP